MRYSCSRRLDWEYRTRHGFNLLSILLFVLFGLFMLLFATFCWKQATGNTFTLALYWAIQTATTVGYGTGFPQQWGNREFWLSIAWMSISVVYWACVLSVVTSRVAEFLEK